MQLRCAACEIEVPAGLHIVRCPGCAGPLDLACGRRLDPGELRGEGVWRYLPWLPVAGATTLGEPPTPLVDVEWEGRQVLLKVEGALPTGSFKDRGAAVLVSWLREMGATEVVEDSSGNAGAALAAYCARAGIGCELFVPESAPPAKLGQIEAYGARVTRVPGPRPAATAAVEHAVAAGAVYASHAWSPLYLAGTQTYAFELWEQLGGEVPDAVVFPVGGGALLLGAYSGFRALRDAGLADRLPRLVCAQAQACAPLVRAFEQGSPVPVAVDAQPSLADGIQVPEPVRGAQILAAIRETGGCAVAVGEPQIAAALEALARLGVLAERTSAVGVAALDALEVAEPGETLAVALTGHGLKTAGGDS